MLLSAWVGGGPAGWTSLEYVQIDATPNCNIVLMKLLLATTRRQRACGRGIGRVLIVAVQLKSYAATNDKKQIFLYTGES